MLTKADFQKAIEESISRYPAVELLYKAGDPRIHQHLDAIATMLAMLSAQIETAQLEAFQKTRDSTILADAAMRGIVRKGAPARASVTVLNKGDEPFTIETGRNLIDTNGRLWQIVTPVTVQAGEESALEAVQQTAETITHEVENTEPFYAVKVPESEDGSYLAGIAVSDSEGVYEYRDRYVNIGVGERVFHVEANERQQVYIRFGYENVIGVQPQNGDKLTIKIYRTFGGDVSVDYGSPFSFEYIFSPAESNIELTMKEMLSAGQNPISMSVLRDLARYPSIYDSNAVFMGEFDFLIRRNFPNLKFLSVWNESAEEQARGASVSNINCLFVSCLSELETEAVGYDIAEPYEISDDELTETQRKIKQTIKNADDSYRVRFYAPIIRPIKITVNAQISSTYKASEIRGKIIETLLKEYGRDSDKVKRGQAKVLYRAVYSLLKENIQALSDGDADLQVSIADPMQQRILPELWRYVTKDSLSVTVETGNLLTPSWGV